MFNSTCHENCFEGSQASLDVIRERIDFRFVQELQINVFAEVLNAVVPLWLTAGYFVDMLAATSRQEVWGP
jgi:hypothetical protein